MSSEDVERFQSSVGGSATIHETPAEEFYETVTRAIEPPAIGTTLPFDGLSLDDTPVETEFTPKTLTEAQTGVTPVVHGIGTYGSVVVPSDATGTELVSLYPPRNVAVLAASTVGQDMQTAYTFLDEFIQQRQGSGGMGDSPNEGGTDSQKTDFRESEPHEGDKTQKEDQTNDGGKTHEQDITHQKNSHKGNTHKGKINRIKSHEGNKSVVLATGPSATADMGTLVHGVHGPKDVHVVLVTDR